MRSGSDVSGEVAVFRNTRSEMGRNRKGLRGEPLKETEIGLMPKSWDGEYYWFWIGTHEEYNRFRF